MRTVTFLAFCSIVFSNAANANQNEVQWRVDAAQYLQRTYGDTAQMVDLFDAVLQRADYVEQMKSELRSNLGHMSECGYNFLPLRAAKANNIDFEKTVPALSQVTRERVVSIDGQNVAPADAVLVTYSPTTAGLFWVSEAVLSADDVVALSTSFDRMQPLWEALLLTIQADSTTSAAVRGGVVTKYPCSNNPREFPAEAYVPFLGKSAAFRLSGLDNSTLQAMSLAQIELLENVAGFMLKAEAANLCRACRPDHRVFEQLAEAKSRKLESFDDLGLGAGNQPQGEGDPGEFDGLDLGDLGLDQPIDSEPNPQL